ncbi:MAG: hypothetical protein Q7J64_04045 [Elusimicrobiota bacterium]|nr:hypothetical protein [Elusimicrobiota bacterium]
MALLALAVFLIASPALADQPAPADAPAQQFISPSALKARADALRDAVADNSVSNVSVKTRATGFFDKLPEQQFTVVAGNYRRMEREPVTGKVGSIAGMTEEAQRRIDLWKRTHTQPPSPEVVASVAQARLLQESKNLNYDTNDELKPNQMGIFQYMRDSFDGGTVKLNERMRILGILVGDAFTYATVSHEAQHSLDRKAGILTPEEEIAGEIRAFRTQYLWLKLMDPNGERMLTLHGTLKFWALRETDDKVKVALNVAVAYLEHLSDVVSTNGDEAELRKLVKKLGYEDGHDHGRAAVSPTSA